MQYPKEKGQTMIYTENKRSSNPNPKNVIIIKTKVLLPQA